MYHPNGDFFLRKKKEGAILCYSGTVGVNQNVTVTSVLGTKGTAILRKVKENE